jgi:hypothetical protein
MKKVMIYITVIPITAALLMLYGCTKEARLDTSFPLPPELADCKIYKLSDGVGSAMYVMRCGNTVSLDQPNGKTRRSVITVDGETYIKQ